MLMQRFSPLSFAGAARATVLAASVVLWCGGAAAVRAQAPDATASGPVERSKVLDG